MSGLRGRLSARSVRAARARGRERGAVAAVVALALVPIIAVTAVGVDAGRVFVERQRVQTAAESAALSAASQWYRTGSACGSTPQSFVVGNAGSDTASTCSTTGSRYGGVVTVTASKSVGAVFASVIGRESTAVRSTASVRIGPAASASGLRPTAMCDNSPALTAWRSGGFSSTQQYTIGITGDCNGVPGNWGVLDFDGGANRTPDLQEWIDKGWGDTVRIGQEFSGDPGIPSPALRMDTVINRTITVPVYDRVRYEGSNAIYRVSSFVTITVISATLNGSASNRNLVVRFATATVGGVVSPTAPNDGTLALQPCSLDGRGTCS